MNKHVHYKIYSKKSNLFFLLLIILLCGNPSHAEVIDNNPLSTIITQKRVTLNIQNKSAKYILTELEKESKIGFALKDDKNISELNNMSINVKNVTVKEALDALLKETNYTYQIIDNIITIQRKMQQINQNNKIAVVGRVIDAETKKGIAGATILVKGTTNGAISDENGKFSFSAGIGQTIEVIYVGMKPYETVINDTKELIISLVKDAIKVDDVVVTGIFDRRAGSFTGSALSLKSEDLKRVGNQNVFASLKNIDPSLMIFDNLESGSDPNKNPKMALRGTSSFDLQDETIDIKGTYGNDPNAPLFILDGFEASVQKIKDLDMNRVESLTILKDASAKAIYGSKAANGVIVIETKKTSQAKLRVTYTGSLDIQAPDLTSYNLTNASQKLELEREARLYEDKNGEFNMELNKKYNRKLTAVLSGIDTDWLSKPLHTGIGNKHAIQFEMGDKELQVFADFSYNNIVGVMKGSDRTNYEGSINLSYVHKKFKFRNILSITSNIAKNSPYGTFDEYAVMNPYYTPYDTYGRVAKNASLPFNGFDFGDEFVPNPLYNAELNTKNEQRYFDITNNLYVEWNILTGMKATVRFGISENTNKADEFYPSNHLKFNNFTASEFAKKGSYQVNNGHEKKLNGDFNLQYSKLVKEKHYFFANVGYTLSESNYEEVMHVAEGFPNDRMTNIIFAKQYLNESKPNGRESTIRDLGVLAAFNYSYDDRYLFDGSFRTNASSQFGSDSRWGRFWSTGIGWNIHKEKFLEDVTAINTLKIRGSIGYTGAQSGQAYAAMATYKYLLDRTYTDYLGAYLQGMQNKSLKWQSKMDYNVGIDINIKRRFMLTFDLYSGKTKNTLTSMTLPPSMGFSTVTENLGTVTNRGFDIRTSYTVWQNSNENSYFSITANVSRNKNIIDGLSNAMRNYNIDQLRMTNDKFSNETAKLYYDGVSMNAIWAMPSLGIDPANGREIYMRKDGTSTYSFIASDQIIAGDEMPKFQGTFGLNFEYKGFGGNLTFRFQYGAKLYNQTLLDKVENANLENNLDMRLYEGVWKNPGDNKPFKAVNEVWVTEDQVWRKEKTRPTSRFVQDRNELTMGNLSLSYDFYRCKFVKKWGMERLKFSFYMNDVFMLSSIDIERGTSYPFARGFNFSLSATF